MLFQRFLDPAQLVATVLTPDAVIGPLPKAFRVIGINKLPPNQYHTSCKKETPTVEAFDEQKGCIYHEMSPVIDSTIDTTAVLHNE
jgi:hypothetical protein